MLHFFTCYILAPLSKSSSRPSIHDSEYWVRKCLPAKAQGRKSRMSRMRSLARTFSRLVLPNQMRFFLCCAGSTSHQQWHQNDDGSNFITAIITAWAKKLSSTSRCSLRSLPIIIFVTISTVFTITQSSYCNHASKRFERLRRDARVSMDWGGRGSDLRCSAHLRL